MVHDFAEKSGGRRETSRMPDCPTCSTPLAPGIQMTCPGCGWSGSEGQLNAMRTCWAGTQVDLPPLPKIERRPALPSCAQKTETLTCPGCWSNGCIREAVAPAAGQLAWYQCSSCSWQGPASELSPEVAEARVTAGQIRNAMREDQRRGKKGGGTKATGKAKPLPKKTCRYRPDRDENAWTRQRAIEPKRHVVRVPGVDLSQAEMEQALHRFALDHLKGVG